MGVEVPFFCWALESAIQTVPTLGLRGKAPMTQPQKQIAYEKDNTAEAQMYGHEWA